MKRLLFTLFLTFVMLLNAQTLTDYRLLLQKGEDSPVASKTLLESSKRAFDRTGKPIYEAFFAVGNFFMAKHAMNPISKYSYFNKGKRALENAVKSDPHNLEIRFMRYISQEQTPGILNYSQNISSDRKYILAEYKKSKDQDLIKRIKMHLKL